VAGRLTVRALHASWKKKCFKGWEENKCCWKKSDL
jgi:hypothetical protein